MNEPIVILATAAFFVTPYGIEFSDASRPAAEAVLSR